MRLVINRAQRDIKGVLGGHKGVEFTLSYRLELGPEELELVQRYKLAEHPLTFRTFEGTRLPDDTIGNLLSGRMQTLKDVTTLLSNENVIKNACDEIPVLFEVCRSFGGHEVVDYPR